jgi:hypothetical protein
MVLSIWRLDYNTVWPHSAFGGEHGLGHATNHVGITSTIKHERVGLYGRPDKNSGAGHLITEYSRKVRRDINLSHPISFTCCIARRLTEGRVLNYHYIICLDNHSDGVLYVLAILLVLALAVIIDRSWSLRSTILKGQSIIRTTAERPALTRADLRMLREAAGGLPE